MAVGVGGEIKPETLERMVDICDLVLVDIQALIQEFDEDGTVKLVGLDESGFFHLFLRLGFLKASEEEAVYMDVEEVRKMCCVVVTHGKEGCNVYWKDGELEIKPFEANQVDPTGVGDSFLGGFVAGLVHGLPVPDAALVGNLFGSLTVSQIGLPKFDSRLLQVLMWFGHQVLKPSRIVEAQSPMAVVIPARGSSFSMKLRDGDISWHDFLGRVKHFKECEFATVEQPVEALTNILFSSGTTGEPKAIPWTSATPLKAAADAWCHLDIHKGDVVAWPTNLGWMLGPWLVYASLLNGASMALYNGSPLSSGFAKFVQDAKVTMLGVIPSIVRAWKSSNCMAGYDWSAIRCFGSTGEASNVDEYLWLMGRACYKPIIEYCGGTEIGGGFITGSFLQAQSLAAFSTPAMGCSLFILGSDGYPIPENVPGIGELALDPFMFGASNKLLNADHHDVYFKGMPLWKGRVLRRHGDVFERTSRGYYHAHGRADDTMNLGGIKVSSVEIERICNAVDNNVLETAAIGVPPSGGGPEQLVIVVVFKDLENTTVDLNQLRISFNSAMQKKLNPLFRVSQVVPLSSLPRTASNKVMRRVLRQELTQGD